ncbi:MAG: peptide chain release factor N(5)-glutamine methyltransferase [Lachnospiraceae bacterium]|nr:peptide chain release factor N(5)-glutamine methyltransferase [Lachnospiraceae bacterium]
MTCASLLQSGIESLRQAGIEDAETDARILFEYVTGMGRNDLILHGDEDPEEVAGSFDPVSEQDQLEGSVSGRESVTERYTKLIARRATHLPVQYITGMADFMGLRFMVNENVLIPRQDTEFLVEEMMREVGDGSSVLDICTGSGCILLSLMRYKNDISGTGCDVSREALEVAKRNEKLIFGNAGAGDIPVRPVTWIESDMFEKIEGSFDHIVCNPPYIRSGVIPTLMPEVREHEPLTALDGDVDGLRFYRILALKAREHINRHGKLFLEIGFDEADAVKALLLKNGYKDIEVYKDYSGNDRVIKAGI